ncbi:MAG TPA: alpha-hydroxy acid oxidase [Bryobacteraceae bacterium]|jgi:isopentenyl diphosphate isomerase/L-lactate dehydrogenase-like FMN-dependent dehydrogenase|nr:alpha-hydroxy acid oxidase [Bryobacteraceae bacterium]
MSTHRDRREFLEEFLKFLAASPLAALPAAAWQTQQAAPSSSGVSPYFVPLTSPKDAFSVMDFEDAARRALPQAHFGYMESGVDDDLTRQANQEGYRHIELRTRRLIDVSKVDTRVELFGSTFEFPVFICPTGAQRMFHPDAELATARAAKAKGALQILSTVTSVSYEEIAKARGGPVWYQLYAPAKWEQAEHIIKRVEAAGCPALALTIDLLGGRNTETYNRARRADKRDCNECHEGAPGSNLAARPMFQGLDMNGFQMNSPSMTWDFVDRVKKITKMKFLLKGLESREDAALAVEHGVDGIIVSNHGGRSMETLKPTIESLPEVLDAVNGRIPVLVDGGVRRGSDVIKALALGAKAVGIGRPYLWGLSSFGQLGVERVLDIMRGELQLAMRQCGKTSLAQIDKNTIAMKRA